MSPLSLRAIHSFHPCIVSHVKYCHRKVKETENAWFLPWRNSQSARGSRHICHTAYHHPAVAQIIPSKTTQIKLQEQWCKFLLKPLWEDRGGHCIAYYTESLKVSLKSGSVPHGQSHSSLASSVRHPFGTTLSWWYLLPSQLFLLSFLTWVFEFFFHLSPHSY